MSGNLTTEARGRILVMQKGAVSPRSPTQCSPFPAPFPKVAQRAEARPQGGEETGSEEGGVGTAGTAERAL